MTDEEVVQLITNEFKLKTLGVTESYLEIHEPVYENLLVKVDVIDRANDDLIIAYLPVKGQYFSFAIYIDPCSKEILNVGTESRNSTEFRATSEELSVEELQGFTILKADNTFNKGDLKPGRKTVYDYSYMDFVPNPEPGKVEDKLKKLFKFLEQDKEGVMNLIANSNAYVQVIMDFHWGNQILGSVGIDLENIKKLNDFNLPIEFSLYGWGEHFK